MNIGLIMTAVTFGAVVANYCELTQLHKDPTGKVTGAGVRDNLTGEEWNVRAKVCGWLFIFRVRNLILSGYYQCHRSLFRFVT